MANAKKDTDLDFTDLDMGTLDDDIDVLFGDEDEDDGFDNSSKKTAAEDEDDSGDDEGGDGGDAISAKAQAIIDAAEARAAEADAKAAAALVEAGKAGKSSLDWQIAFADAKEEALNAKIANLNKELDQAEEDGDTKKKREIEEELLEARETRTKVKDAKAAIQARKEAEDKNPPQTKPAERDPNNLDPEAASWASRNQWIANPSTDDEVLKRHHALKIDSEMLREGKLNKNSKAYYDELDRRIAKKMEKSTKAGDAGRKKQRSHVAPAAAGSNGDKSKSKSSVTITPVDVAMMKRLGLDPRDSEHIGEYARNKRDTERDSGDESTPKFPIRRPVNKK